MPGPFPRHADAENNSNFVCGHLILDPAAVKSNDNVRKRVLIFLALALGQILTEHMDRFHLPIWGLVSSVLKQFSQVLLEPDLKISCGHLVTLLISLRMLSMSVS